MARAMGKIAKNDDRLAELILYLSDKCASDETWGAVKLNKLLFYIDFMAYLNLGKPVTGHEYFKLPQGPGPKLLKPITERMTRNKEFALQERLYHGRTQKRPIALRVPDISDFTPHEISLVDEVIKKWWGKTATQISDKSHLFAGWIFAEEKEVIPYQVSLVGHRPLTPKEIAYGQCLQAEAAGCLGGIA